MDITTLPVFELLGITLGATLAAVRVFLPRIAYSIQHKRASR